MKKLTKTQKEEIAVLSSQPENEIDTGDIPELIAEQVATAQVGRFYKSVKQPVTIRLDADVLSWFKNHYGKYQTRVNQILREHMKSNS